jgi:hypothetical protein
MHLIDLPLEVIYIFFQFPVIIKANMTAVQTFDWRPTLAPDIFEEDNILLRLFSMALNITCLPD